jgi:Tfp pilus assembly protein PilF
VTPSFRREILPAALLLLAGTAFVYGGTAGNGFIAFDDHSYIYENPIVARGLSWEGVRWAFTTFHRSNWHPLSWLSHMADASLFGLWAGGHHLVSAALHALSSLLLFLALRSMTALPWRSLAVALLFALHPLHVESVAWAAERKDVLCGLFWHGGLLAYAGYGRRGGAGRYALVLLLFVLALLSKPMAVTFPFVLLLLDWWPLGRLRLPSSGGEAGAGERPGGAPRAGGVPFRRLAAEKAPLFLLSAASCAVTVAAQSRGGAVVAVPLSDRLLNGATAYAAYLGKCAWPSGLAPFYPHPTLLGHGPDGAAAAAAVLLLAAVTAAALLLGRRHPHLPVGWFWYLGTLVPVIGVVQAGAQSMADRYGYLPLTGIFLAAAFSVPVPAGGWDRRKGLAAVCLAALLLLPLAEAARRQAGRWKDGETLFGHAVAATRGNWVALTGYGAALSERGRPAEGLPYLEEAVRARPEHFAAWLNLGDARRALGDPAAALDAYDRAARIAPLDEAPVGKAGIALFALGRRAEAIARFRQAVSMTPAYADGWYNLGVALLETGDPGGAERAFREDLLLRPGHVDGGRGLAAALARQGKEGERLPAAGDGNSGAGGAPGDGRER